MSQNLEDRNEFSQSEFFKKMFITPDKNPESEAINGLDKILNKIPTRSPSEFNLEAFVKIRKESDY